MTVNSVLDSLYEILNEEYVNVVLASLVIPGYQRGNCKSENSAVKCEQSYNGENEAIREQEAAMCSLPQDKSDDESVQQCKLGRCYKLSAPINDYSIFYIGHESRTLSNIIISYQSCQVH